MMRTTLVGVSRAAHYSPNHIESDARILSLTANSLERRGYAVSICAEENLVAEPLEEVEAIFSMARSEAALQRLQEFLERGIPVLNSPSGIRNGEREPLTRLLQTHQIPSPQSIIVNTDEEIISQLQSLSIDNGWVKRGAGHTLHREDVSYFRHREEAQEIVRELARRGIRRAILNRHLVGDLVKFYGVSNTFFYWFYPYGKHFSKFGYESVNGPATGYPFSETLFRSLCTNLSEQLDLPIYGGDAIVSWQGEVALIDFNDWPSFAPCREVASEAIADYIDNVVKKKPLFSIPIHIRSL